jgi:hypothetical protein
MSEMLAWPEGGFTIEFIANELSDPNYLTRLMIDRLFNAFGYECSSHFDADNNLLKWR